VKHAVELIPFVQVKQQKIWCDCVKLCHSSFRELAEANLYSGIFLVLNPAGFLQLVYVSLPYQRIGFMKDLCQG